MKKKAYVFFLAALALVIAPSLLMASGKSETAPAYPTKPMEFIAPAGAGGGWDLTIRTVAKVLAETDLSPVATPVTNKPGGGGGVALAYLQNKKGSDREIAVYSPPLILINLSGTTPYSYKNTTPIARLIADYGAFVVSKNSKYKNIMEVMDALKKDQGSVVIGGTSAAGSMDHIQFLMVARAAGVKNLNKIQYVSFQDGSGAAQALGGHIDLLSTGLGDVRGLLQSGDLRGLASTAPQRVDLDVIRDIPTCKEQGLDAIFINWRGIFGPPEMPEYAVNFWRQAVGKMVTTSAWEAACKQNGFTMSYMDGPEFGKFLEQTNEDYKAVLSEIGMLKLQS
ncbi:MAG TPA: tripartite tricarboxylate transporter substrate-binding protein [Spirochaetia bacterium]|nr:tripartite tricarboxylate transporter substrate-binding protein [Spirochaetia bacterium]